MNEQNGSSSSLDPTLCAWYSHQTQIVNIILSSQTNDSALRLHRVFYQVSAISSEI